MGKKRNDKGPSVLTVPKLTDEQHRRFVDAMERARNSVATALGVFNAANTGVDLMKVASEGRKPILMIKLPMTSTRGACQRAIVRMLNDTRKHYVLKLKDVIARVEPYLDIPAEKRAINPDDKHGEQYWMQDVRNALKFQTSPEGQCMFTRGELILLDGGGVALPGHTKGLKVRQGVPTVSDIFRVLERKDEKKKRVRDEPSHVEIKPTKHPLLGAAILIYQQMPVPVQNAFRDYIKNN